MTGVQTCALPISVCSRCGRTIFRWELDSGLAGGRVAVVCSDCLKKRDPSLLSARLAQIQSRAPVAESSDVDASADTGNNALLSRRTRWAFIALAAASIIVFGFAVRAILNFDVSIGRRETIIDAHRLLSDLRTLPALNGSMSDTGVRTSAGEQSGVQFPATDSSAMDAAKQEAARAFADVLKKPAALADGLAAASDFRDRLEAVAVLHPGESPAKQAERLAARLSGQIDGAVSQALNDALDEIRRLSDNQKYSEAQTVLDYAAGSLRFASPPVQAAYSESLESLERALDGKCAERVESIEARLTLFLRADDFDSFDSSEEDAAGADDPLIRAAADRWLLIGRETLLYLSDTRSAPGLATHRRLSDALNRYDEYLSADDYPAAKVVAESFADISSTAVIDPYGVSIASAFRQAARSARLLDDLSRSGFASGELNRQASAVVASLSGTAQPVLSPLVVALYDYRVAKSPNDLLLAAKLETLDCVPFRRLNQRLRVRVERMNASLLALDELRALEIGRAHV